MAAHDSTAPDDDLIVAIRAMGGDLVADDAAVLRAEAAGSRDTAIKRGMAMTYIWGRQDAGESDRDTGYSQTFASIYAVINHVTRGYVGPLQSVHHEWTETGRVLVRLPNCQGIAQVAATGQHGAVEARMVPRDMETSIRYWPGIVRAASTSTASMEG